MTTVNPATLAATTADDIRRLLAEGKTVQEVADTSSWPRQRILAVINGVKGWLLDAETDKVYQPGNRHMIPSLPEGVDPAPSAVLRIPGPPSQPSAAAPKPAAAPSPRRPAEKPEPAVPASVEQASPTEDDTRAILALITSLRREMTGYSDPAVSRELERASAALERLETALTTGQERREAEAAVARAREELAAAEARLKAVKSGKTKPAPAPVTAVRATAKEIRAWCAEQGIPVNEQGQIPKAVRDRYDAAHPTA